MGENKRKAGENGEFLFYSIRGSKRIILRFTLKQILWCLRQCECSRSLVKLGWTFLLSPSLSPLSFSVTKIRAEARGVVQPGRALPGVHLRGCEKLPGTAGPLARASHSQGRTAGKAK
jgi:hypothetical protein